MQTQPYQKEKYEKKYRIKPKILEPVLVPE